MARGTTMAKPKRTKAKADPDGMVTRAVRMRQEYADWLERFAKEERVNLASLIDRALSSHAEKSGFDSPPERIP
jgi:predicted DNA-binding ribbon-helix-helix protein